MSRCAGKNVAGDPCRAHAMRGRDRCIAHAEKEIQASVGFGGAQPGGGRPRNPRAVDVIRERIEADIDKYLRVPEEALNATRVVGYNSDGEAIEMPDHPTRLAAFKEILDRSYGRPKQQTEVTGADGGPLQVTDLSWLR